MPFSRADPQASRRARGAAHGRARAAFWRALGWPNLARAREARRRNCEQRRAALTGAEQQKKLAAGERWRKWHERRQAMQAARNDPALWGFVRMLAARPEPSARALARKVSTTEKLVERGERMLGARERRNARVRQQHRLARLGLTASNESLPPAYESDENEPVTPATDVMKPVPSSQPAPQPSRTGFIDMPYVISIHRTGPFRY